jgi:RNA-binding protein MEX3
MDLPGHIKELLTAHYMQLKSQQSPVNSLDRYSSLLLTTPSSNATGSISSSCSSTTDGSNSSSYFEDLLSPANAAMATNNSQNITESVPVPSSEHVAEIVGRQGCKIIELRSKTNTYIKTPVRGEEPMFMITGRRDDVIVAKSEIQRAADHFTQIRAQRRNNGNRSSQSSTTSSSEYSLASPLMFPQLTTGTMFDFSTLSESSPSTSSKEIFNQGIQFKLEFSF